MRGKWEIILDLLKNLEEKGECKKTRLMQATYLDWNSFKKYFNYLKENDYIKKLENNNGHNEDYNITKEGKKLLKELKDVEEILPDQKILKNN